MSYTSILTEIRSRVGLVTLNRPDAKGEEANHCSGLRLGVGRWL